MEFKELVETLVSKEKFAAALINAPPANIANIDKVVTFVKNRATLQKCRQRFLQAIIVGLDTETKPEYKKKANSNRVALLQIAIRDSNGVEEVFILDLLTLKVEDYDVMLSKLFGSTSIIKMGQGLLEDLKQLHEAYPKAKCFLKMNSVVEANDMLQVIVGDKPLLSLQKIVYFCMKKKLVKTQQKSNWERRPLAPGQLHYAALDALVLIWIHDYLIQLIKQPFHMDAIWKSWDLNKEIELPCKLCGRCFQSDHALYTHTLACSQSAEKNVTCELCPRRFKSDDAMKQHLVHCMNKGGEPLASVKKTTEQVKVVEKPPCYCGRTIADEKWNAGHPIHYMCESYKMYATLSPLTKLYVWTCVACSKVFESPEKLLYHHGLCQISSSTKSHVHFDSSPKQDKKRKFSFDDDTPTRLRYKRTASADFTESAEEESLWNEVGKWSYDIDDVDTDTSSY
ncbi:hypothetical protein THRCLA_05426 [Thraustotheca clavata]|uniref:C2H2-type domain-containing protein n=1 Tax=Thraustotheca clavata TaxID=74557 RepID=A0A1V9ZWL5_9STRA|nr:hypothetical protein THRCLA_05426 [Thraustotheca clavata]